MRIPPQTGMNVPLVLSPLNIASGAYVLGMGAALYSSGAAWPAANRAIFAPIILNDTITITTAGWLNGATVSGTGHVDVGVYDKGLNKIVTTGSTTQGSAAAFQSAGLSSTTLNPDLYWLAMACDNTTSSFQAATALSTGLLRTCGVQQMSSAFVLPSAITLTNPASAYWPYVVVGGTL